MTKEEKTRVLLLEIRRGLLIINNCIEEYLDLERTKDLRKQAKQDRRAFETFTGEAMP